MRGFGESSVKSGECQSIAAGQFEICGIVNGQAVVSRQPQNFGLDRGRVDFDAQPIQKTQKGGGFRWSDSASAFINDQDIPNLEPPKRGDAHVPVPGTGISRSARSECG